MCVLVNSDAGTMNACSSVFTSDVILSCLVTCVQKEFEAIDFTASRKNFHFISNMLVGKIFFFDLKFVVFLKSVFCVWNRGVNHTPVGKLKIFLFVFRGWGPTYFSTLIPNHPT